MTWTMDPWTFFVVWTGGTAAGIAIGLGICWVAARLYDRYEHWRYIRRIT